MDELHDVVIAGAGPIGLFLACELGLAGTSVLVPERDRERESAWKVAPLGLRGLNTVSVEGFYRRGLLDRFFEPSERPSTLKKTPGVQFGGHFAGITLDANKLDLERWPYRIPGPALTPGPTTIDRVERVLTERAEGLGVTILRGTGVRRIVAQDANSVTVEAGRGQRFRGRWLVGCDGGRSVVRRTAGFDFVGTEAKFTGYVLKCDLDHPERLKPGFSITKSGMYITGQPKALYLVDFDGAAFERTQDLELEHLQQVLDRVTESAGVKITKLYLASSFTDRSKQATCYRKGRVLLAGDAAHIHSPLGAQGLNLGLGDAMNLGWKLASTIRRESKSDGGLPDMTLIDTYEAERRPVGAWVLEWTRVQVSTLQPDLYGCALQSLMRDLIATEDGTNLFIDRCWGLSQRYNLGDTEAHSHPLVGCSAPDFEFFDGSRLGPKLENGRGLLLDSGADAALKALVTEGKHQDRVEYMSGSAKDRRGIGALLVRPDGVIAWVATDAGELDRDAALVALEQWFSY